LEFFPPINTGSIGALPFFANFKKPLCQILSFMPRGLALLTSPEGNIMMASSASSAA